MSTTVPVATPQMPSPNPKKERAESRHDSLGENIFERSVSTNLIQLLPRTRGSIRSSKLLKGRSMSVASNASFSSLGLLSAYCSTEDFVAPVLDTTAEILCDPLIDLNNVTIVCRECDNEDLHQSRLALSPSRSTPSKSFQVFRKNSHCRHRKHEKHTENGLLPQVEGQTINFYSFAEVLDGEKEGQEFQAITVGEYLS